MKEEKLITVTEPLLPPLEEFVPYLQKIWESKWITNNGSFHKELEQALCDYLGVEYLSLFTNGTLPLIVAFQALGITEGEVITTPFSFVATTSSICWNKLTPVFVDVDPATGNIDPAKIEEAITPRTVAIMPVHVYGTPCDTKRIADIAERHNLKVVYDAAHAFGVKQDGKSILKEGDMATLSFHATKAYTTIEGGALICHSREMKEHVDRLRNFGFANETEVIAAGMNSKMDEVRSAYGLLSLNYVDNAIASRKKATSAYREALKDVEGISFLDDMDGVHHNYSYFPIFVDKDRYGISRDELYAKLKDADILARRYFYPLISDFAPFKDLPSSAWENLPNAHKLAESVVCLPMHHELGEEDIQRVLDVIVR